VAADVDRDRFVKERPHAVPGSIPHALDMFRNEVRFYREVAPEVGVRVPRCFAAEEDDGGFRLELEDLGSWASGGDPRAVAAALSVLHARWEGAAMARWPWLRRVGAGADLIAELYDRTWPSVERREDVSATVVAAGRSYVGRVHELELAEGEGGPLTLVHGDAALRNVRTSANGTEVAFVDWEDVRVASGSVDLAWLLVSSVEPGEWDGVVAVADPNDRDGLAVVGPTAISQAILSLSDLPDGGAEAAAAVRRIEAAVERWFDG
jgi:hypothetical protein